jgi:hypothetical protein
MFQLLPILWMIFVVGVMYNIWQDLYLARNEKFLWMGVVFFFPGIGIIFWLMRKMRL